MNEKIVMENINEIKEYHKNSRIHSDEQIQQIANSIIEFGFVNPILIDENNMIIAGHGRLLAAKRLKISNVPCIKIDYLTEAQKKAYIIADNKIALNSEWDFDLLQEEIESLQSMEFDINLTGFDLSEFEYKSAIDIDEMQSINNNKNTHKCPKCGFEFEE